MSFDERQHPRNQTGRFTNSDADRDEPGQVLAAPQPPSPEDLRRRMQPQRPQHVFTVVSEVDHDTASALMARRDATVHAKSERSERLALAQRGPVYKAFAVDRGRGRDNLELHVITTDAEVHIFSVRTAKLITMLYARPAQVVRYFPKGVRVEESVMDSARNNVALARNKH